MSTDNPRRDENRYSKMDLQELTLVVKNMMNACNLRGVLIAAHHICCRLCDLFGDADRAYQHPLMMVLLDVAYNTAHNQHGNMRVSDAYSAVIDTAAGQTLHDMAPFDWYFERHPVTRR